MNLADFQNIDFNNLGSAPVVVRVVLIVIAVSALLGAGYYFDTQDRIIRLTAAETKEKNKRTEFDKLYGEAINLKIYEQQMVDLTQSFGIMLRQLPRKAEVDALLADISQSGIAAGLEFELFKPGAPSSQEGFQYLPIQITVTGNYHQFGQFVSSVASLPRIVTLHNATLKLAGDNKDKNKKGKLRMDAVAKIYHYFEEGSNP